MQHAPVDPRSVVGIRPSAPLTRFTRAMSRRAQNVPASGDKNGLPVELPEWNRGSGLMRRMLVAAAIATGLVALWALLVPLVP
jgi:hypothetical protein